MQNEGRDGNGSEHGGAGGASPTALEHRLETGLTLGEFLRAERESRGLVIEQVASATKISLRSLHALEADLYSELPAKPFVRGFVTSYSRFLGLDPREVLTRFGSFIDEKARERPKKDSGHEGYAFERKENDPSRRMLWIIMGSITVLGVIALILKPSLRGGRHRHLEKLRATEGVFATPSPLVSPSASPVTGSPPNFLAGSPPRLTPSGIASPSPQPTPSTSASPTPPQAASPQPAASPLPSASPTPDPDPLHSGKDLPSERIRQKLVLEALEDVWVRYRCDERPLTRFIFKKGKTLVLRAENSIIFQASNPDSVRVRSGPRGGGTVRGDSQLRELKQTSTLAFPAKAFEEAGELLKNEPGLPKTPGPTPVPTASPPS